MLSASTRIDVHTVQELQSHCAEVAVDLGLAETEHTWQKIERALGRLQALTRGGAFKFTDEFVYQIKQLSDAINTSLLSERTKLSGTAGDLLNSVAPRLADKFEPLVSVFVPTLLLICARTNKVAVKRAEKTLHLIIRHCKLSAAVVPFLREAVRDKGQGLRVVVATTFVLILLQASSSNTDAEKLSRRVQDVEAAIRQTATDSNSEVRQAAKKMFELYTALWPERVEMFTKPMTPTIRRYLALPKTGSFRPQLDVPEAGPSRSSNHNTTGSPLPPTPLNRPAAQPKSLKVVRVLDATPQSSAIISSSPIKSAKHGSDALSAGSGLGARPVTGRSRSEAWVQSDPTPQSGKRKGLFAEQIAAARTARLARSTDPAVTPGAMRVVSLDISTPTPMPSTNVNTDLNPPRRKRSLETIQISSSSSSTSSDSGPKTVVTSTKPRPVSAKQTDTRTKAPLLPRNKSIHDINQHFLPGSTKERNCSMPTAVLIDKPANIALTSTRNKPISATTKPTSAIVPTKWRAKP